ncbi:hypothetical protein GCL60_07010 [Silvanigrella paludirubra]|uniref:Uncharacterized protein n=1 Tax=Silvanigrella paludirubra TaxID=2499159 RepID=A0A6N6VX43_9BACT|nr:hypothetical protein [Silvanigrella paludirubra]KAB8040007.1 hypothetical protein GCL60_07010 [Silvanigrella paludirubra]
MDSKLSSLISNLKNINSEKIVDTLKKNQENLNPKAMIGLAKKAVDQARSFSKEEIQFLLGKVNDVGHKTSTEIEKSISKLVNKLLEGQPAEVATNEVRNEIISILVEHNSGKNLLPIVKYVNSVVVSNAPTNIESFKNFRKNIAQTLISDAKKRISDRNIIDAQVVSEHPEKKHNKKDRHKARETN